MGDYFSINGYTAAEVALGPNSFWGTGHAEFPALMLGLRMVFRCPEAQPKVCHEFRELRCRLFPFDSPMPIANGRTLKIEKRVPAGGRQEDNYIHIEIPLDRTRIAFIERMRKGGDARFRLDFEMVVDEFLEVNKLPGQHYERPILAFLQRHRTLADLKVTFAQSDWVKGFLKNTGYGQTHIIELPRVPIEKTKVMKASFEALERAQELESKGFYDDAVAKCRLALEPFFETTDKTDDKGVTKKIPVLKAAWQTRLGKASYDWLNAAFIATKQATNQSHHLSSSAFGQMEAQILLVLTTALIAYAVETQAEKS